MLQNARSNTSDSLFREAEYATIVLDTTEKEEHFKRLSTEVAKNRKAHKASIGANALRTQFLAALKQLDDVKTANIWARKLLIETNTIQSLRVQIEDMLRKNHVYGVVEIHLQDYEVNSTHIQFVGTKTHEAEKLIAELMVKLGYEDSFASAVGREERQEVSKSIQPPKAPKPTITKTTKDGEVVDMDEELNKIKNLKIKLLKDKLIRLIEKVEKVFQRFKRKNPRKEDTETLLERYRARRNKK